MYVCVESGSGGNGNGAFACDDGAVGAVGPVRSPAQANNASATTLANAVINPYFALFMLFLSRKGGSHICTCHTQQVPSLVRTSDESDVQSRLSFKVRPQHYCRSDR